MSPAPRFALVALLCVLSGAASSQPISYGEEGGGYGYGGPLVRGEYVGAPLTRFPRPSELVPSAWGYGTYGIPTVAGIRPAPVGTPTVYVIDGQGQDRRHPAATRSRVLSRDRDGNWSEAGPYRSSNARIVAVTVPRR